MEQFREWTTPLDLGVVAIENGALYNFYSNYINLLSMKFVYPALLEIYKNPPIYSQTDSFPTPHLRYYIYIYIYT